MTYSRVAALILFAAVCLSLIGCMPTSTSIVKDAVPDNVKYIFVDAKQYEVLWMRRTVTDWALGLFAAGTAIAAAVKNAFSAHNQAQSQSQGNANIGRSQTSTNIDRVVMVCAALAVIATTLDAKMHAAQTAERYRQGDLLLQDAIMDYRLSTESAQDKERELLEVWHQAQRILEGAPAVSSKSDPNKKAQH